MSTIEPTPSEPKEVPVADISPKEEAAPEPPLAAIVVEGEQKTEVPTTAASESAPVASEPEPVATVTEEEAAKTPFVTFEQFRSSSESPISSKWTEDEWKKVFELSERISQPKFYDELSIEGLAYPSPIAIWGVHINPAKDAPNEIKAKAAVVVYKFFKANELDLEKGYEQLVNTLKWRAEYKPEETKNDVFPEEIFKRLGFVGGKTNSGIPVTYNIYGEVKDTKETFGELDRFIKWRVQLMESGISQLDFYNTSTMIQVHDYAGVPVFSGGRDQYTKAAASKASKLFSDYYPELLDSKWFLNVPTVLSWIFKLFSNFLSQRTLDKFKVFGPDQATIHKALNEVIDDEELPKRFGGKAVTVLDA